jgi:hypothetical protein
MYKSKLSAADIQSTKDLKILHKEARDDSQKVFKEKAMDF